VATQNDPPRGGWGISSCGRERWCYETLRRLRWPQGVRCPRCQGAHVTTHSTPSPSPRRKYLCRGCRRTFTDLTGTPLARTNLPLEAWFLYLQLGAHGSSTSEVARALRVKWDTAAFLRRRLAATSHQTELVHQLREAACRSGPLDER
jgi:transposase-like protein